MMPNGLEEQNKVNEQLVEISAKTDIPLIATNDCHYLNRADSKAHEILMCVQQKRTIKDSGHWYARNIRSNGSGLGNDLADPRVEVVTHPPKRRNNVLPGV